jgi:hypothetical protein
VNAGDVVGQLAAPIDVGCTLEQLGDQSVGLRAVDAWDEFFLEPVICRFALRSFCHLHAVLGILVGLFHQTLPFPQPRLNQAADGFGTAEYIRLASSPSIRKPNRSGLPLTQGA